MAMSIDIISSMFNTLYGHVQITLISKLRISIDLSANFCIKFTTRYFVQHPNGPG